jgi:hypothetical protein
MELYPVEKTTELSKLLTTGTWTHDYPITFERACELGPYPQPLRRQPSVSIFRFVSRHLAPVRNRAIDMGRSVPGLP